MRAAWLVVVAACGSKSEPPPAPASGSAPADAIAGDADAAATEWSACEQTLRGVMKLPATRRVQALLDGCKPCGDWTPLLQWDTQQVDGGPTRASIEAAMLACKGYCDGNAKARFLGTLDNARGKGTRGPWRFLGDACKDKVSAVPDTRYMSAPYFALDRIARAAGERPELAPLLDAIVVPLPALTVTGSGFELATSPVTAPDAGMVALTVTPTEIRVAASPRGKLGKDGVRIVSPGEPYPGVLVKARTELDAAVAALGDTPAGPLAIYAPRGMAAAPVVAALALAPERPVRLAVAAHSDLPGWPNTGAIPIALRARAAPQAVALALDDDVDAAVKRAVAAKPQIAKAAEDARRRDAAAPAGKPPTPSVQIRVGPKATVGGLAKLLGALGYFDVKSAAIVASK